MVFNANHDASNNPAWRVLNCPTPVFICCLKNCATVMTAGGSIFSAAGIA